MKTQEIQQLREVIHQLQRLESAMVTSVREIPDIPSSAVLEKHRTENKQWSRESTGLQLTAEVKYYKTEDRPVINLTLREIAIFQQPNQPVSEFMAEITEQVNRLEEEGSAIAMLKLYPSRTILPDLRVEETEQLDLQHKTE